jgi:hypothetical protein
MVYREIIAACSEMLRKYTLWEIVPQFLTLHMVVQIVTARLKSLNDCTTALFG